MEALWDELDASNQQRITPGMSDSVKSLTLAQYERLIEITQEKGTSECLPPRAEDLSEDCGFELFLTRQSRPTEPEDFSEQEWQQMRSTYARSLVGRGRLNHRWRRRSMRRPVVSTGFDAPSGANSSVL